MFSQAQVEEIVDLLSTLDLSTKIYFGCDSVRVRKKGRWYATFATVFIVHINGKNGCRLFSHMSTEPDYDVKLNRPKMRMMNEVQKVCELYTQLIPFIDEFDIEVHLDISQNPKHGSNCAASEAAGYVLGMTGLPEKQIKLKPDSFAASFGADRAANGRMERQVY
jgi:predicted RNase H-related nuclease YkuK (DUF458 family)